MRIFAMGVKKRFDEEELDNGIWEGAIVYKMGLYDYTINALIP